MRDKHFVFALVLLVLPLSFGGDLSAGSKAAAEVEAANATSRLTARTRPYVAHGFTTAQIAASLAESPIGNGDAGRSSGLYASSFDATKSSQDARCGSAADINGNREFNNMNADCISVGSTSLTARTSASGFPMYDSFNGSETAQHSGAAGSGPFGIGAGGGGGVAGGNGPTGSGPANPNVPISAPEPGTLLLLTVGLVVVGGLAKRRAIRASVISN